jgi:hypothetical protein
MKLIFVIQNNAIANNYKIFINELCNQGFQVQILAHKLIDLTGYSISRIHVAGYELSKNLNLWEEIFNYAELYQHTTSSISFKERYNWRVKKFNEFKPEIRRNSIKNFAYLLKRYLQIHYASIIITILARTKAHRIFRPFFYKFFPISEISAFISGVDNNTVIFLPYWGVNAEANFLLQAVSNVKSKNVITCFIQENWDNLSSKSVMYFKPDYLFVWGEQSKEHAIKIQKFDKDRIHYLQSPRYLEFYNYWIDIRKSYKTREENKTILYLGDSTSCDEVKVINFISDYVKSFLPEWTIIYRPHPFMRSNYKKKFSQDSLPENVIIDKEMREEYFRGTTQKNYSTKADLGYLLKCLRKADLIISGGSTSFLEAVLCLKPILFMNGRLRSTTVLKKEHFKGVENLDCVFVMDEMKLDNIILDDFFNSYFHGGFRKIDNSKIDYFFHLNQDKYVDRFKKLLNITYRNGSV